MAGSDDYSSSLSGYESIEAESSNYEAALSRKVEDMKASLNTGGTSFANPHYLCPDVQVRTSTVNLRNLSNLSNTLGHTF